MVLPGYGVEVLAIIHDHLLGGLVNVDLLDVALGHLLQRLFWPGLTTFQQTQPVRNNQSMETRDKLEPVTSNQSMVQQLMRDGK